jgi:integrase
VREVQMSPHLVEVLIEHRDRLRRAGRATSRGGWVCPNLLGGRMCRQRVGEIVAEVAVAAREQMRTRELPALPQTTPHTLRRTYISIALLASNFDVKWVMGQVGHADSKMTLDVYTQLQQRVARSHGVAFDRILSEARDRLGSI